MKLILREYLASLRERKELDALLPDLLSQMGLDVFSKPGVGSRQYGVDIAAFGSIDGAPESVYLLSVKSGDLGRRDWTGSSVQDLRPSLDEIIDVYIPTHLPPVYKDKPIVICLCFGGEIKENVRLNVTAYEEKHTTVQISFREWSGEVIAGYIESYLLKEELLPKSSRPLLRKSLALLDEPASSFNYFRELVHKIAVYDEGKPEKILIIIRQLNLCLWVLYAWCREQNNIESAYKSSELVTLYTWELGKPFLGETNKLGLTVIESLHSIQDLHIQISSDFVENIVFPHADKLHALSSAVSPSCAVDVNLKLFDIFGRVALSGLWAHLALSQVPDLEIMKPLKEKILDNIQKHHDALIKMINNNPILFSPYKDDQAIDIGLVVYFLGLMPGNKDNIQRYLFNVIQSSLHLLNKDGSYPCNLRGYHELIEHEQRNKDGYIEEVTAGSILYPLIAIIAGVYGFDDVYAQAQQIKPRFLEHCNFQVWYPNGSSEGYFYNNSNNHGAILSHVPISENKEAFLSAVFKECEESKYFEELSGVEFEGEPYPLLLMACRHYRLPVPIQIFRPLYHP